MFVLYNYFNLTHCFLIFILHLLFPFPSPLSLSKVLDRIAGEAVGRMFDAIDQALYEGCPTGQEEVDRECTEWSINFPHFR